jgi:type IV secretion system protein VirB10
VPPEPKGGGPDINKMVRDDKKAQIAPARLKSPMGAATGGGSPIKGLQLEGGAEATKGLANYPKTTAAQVQASRAGDPEAMIAQGKIIDAVLETAINTDLSGILRAEVSRDVFAEAGQEVLIPKGSRLIGTYDTAVKRGQKRVYIIWNRVIRPDGIDMIITSPSSDQLGRAGAEGEVDNKYLEIFSNSILLSTIQVAFAYAAQEATGSEGTTQKENTTGSVQTTGKPADLAVVDAVNSFGSTVKSITSDLVSVRPTITVEQGTRIKVFVNKDVIIPEGELGKSVLVIR